MPRNVTEKQKRKLLSRGSPLTPAQKARFKRELKAGHVTVHKTKAGMRHAKKKKGRG